ncbi:MAG: hypothetical protein KME60_11080 [Cyanomargarita calcarea GSE-NOS-MK-12-04C]|jgi:hypothetical protein|uniref:Uncharacterized protein n=1 Tax=Cyanomargarita calcarea GSE-NOS-MK-12-04C TaxID=2839659 RepID=A0A951USN2_9CYAN|nr:hypothetical protein [Cyanomargarita calcarea GSE-NOS-MK-12-04C]
MTSQKYEPTTEDLERWEKLDELGMTAMCGTPMSDEEYEHRLQSVIDGSCFVKYLDKVLKQKQELEDKLAGIEKTEQMLRTKIAEFKTKK